IPSRIIRPRIIIYATVIVGLMVLFAYSLFTRSPIGLDVIRDRNQLYREVDGKIENVYTLRLLNMDSLAHKFDISVAGLPELELAVEFDNVEAPSGEVLSVPVRVIAEEHNLSARSSEIEFTIAAQDDESLTITESARFLGPIQ
ncbi:MAG: FixG Ig-like domain-containing protein, partial [Gammaproteobacteria bacterium]